VIASIAAGAAHDADGIENLASSSTYNQVTYDTTQPTLTYVHIASNNANPTIAVVGNRVTLTVRTSESLDTLTAAIAGHAATVSGSGTNWTAWYTMTSEDTEGEVAFGIAFSDRAGNDGAPVTATTDSSSVTFIKTAFISVSAPNGGESWLAGTRHTISWTFANVTGNVKIELLKGGVLNRVIISSTSIGSGGSGSYSWLISSAQAAGADYRVRVTSLSQPTCADTGNADFAITRTTSRTVTVVSPNGGESWVAGTRHTISWTFVNVTGYVRIELLKGGAVNRVISYYTWVGVGGSGFYSWMIPSTQAAGTDYKIRITSWSYPTCTDTSNNNFAITRP
jgi:hypothetical protein